MRDDMLIRLRRYQHLLLVGGGALITMFVVLACVLQIWTTVSSYVAATRDEMTASAHRAEDGILRLAVAMRGDVRSIASSWAVLAAEQQMTGAPIDRDLAEAVASVRSATELSVYLLDGDLRPIVVSTALGQGLRWNDVAMPDRAQAARALRDSVVPYLPAPEDIPFMLGGPPIAWVTPHTSPITGQRVISAITTLTGFEGRVLGTLVFELPLSTLAATVAWDAKRGQYLVLSPDGELILPSMGNEHPDTLALAHVAQGNGLGLGRERQSVYADGYLLSSWMLEPTPWRLVYALSRQDIVSGVAAPAVASILTGALIIAVAWLLLMMLKRKVFLPAVAQSQLVFESEQLSRALVDTAPVGLGLIAINTGQPLLRSTAMEEVEARALVPGGNLSAELCAQFLHHEMRAGQDTEAALNLELSLATRAGPPMDLSVSLARARYKGEDVLVAAFTDVTAQKQVERALHEARQAADSANAAKSAFLAAMSHEIRTPLNAIQGNLELLSHSTLDPVQRDRLTIIRSASEDLLSTVSDVLDFSKIEAGELHLEQVVFDVHEVAARSLIMFAPLAKAKGLVLEGEFGWRPAQPMRGDPTRLAQVLNNLLSNALKFTANGKVTLRLALEAASRQLVVSVEDTGIGLSPEQIAGLFRAFSQADATINRRFGGTGLGLALCARLTRAMGGHISVASEPGRGSCFTLRLGLGEGVPTGTMPIFAGEQIVLVAGQGGAYVARALSAWGLRPQVFSDASKVSADTLKAAAVTIFWGEREASQTEHENRLVEDSKWVIDCAAEGPSRPVAVGRLISISIFGLRGLMLSLEFALQRRELAMQARPRYRLGQALKVLVVEDHPVTRRLLEEQLTLLGCQVHAVPDGQQALQQLEREGCEVFMTDLSMPGMDGYELVRRVRQQHPWLPILVVTADVTPQQTRRFAHDTRIKVLGKPLALEALGRALSQISGVRPVVGEPQLSDDLLGGKPLPEELRQTFQTANEASLEAMREAWEKNDVPRLLAELHALRGALNVFGMEWLAKQSAELSQALKQGDMQSHQTRFARFCFDLQRTFSVQSAPEAHADRPGRAAVG